MYRLDWSESGCSSVKGLVVGAGAKDFSRTGRTVTGAAAMTGAAISGASDVREGVVGKVGSHGMPDSEALVVG